MLKMAKESKAFLEKYLPEALNTNTVGQVLDMLFDLIEEKGYASPDYYDYNEFGREAQKVYDSIYLNNP